MMIFRIEGNSSSGLIFAYIYREREKEKKYDSVPYVKPSGV